MALKVLIVDDEFPSRQELRCILEDICNVEVIGECLNGEQALRFLDGKAVDAVFLDIEMPVLDGLGAAEKLAEKQKQVKIVFTTGFSEFAVKAFELAADDYVLKPYTRERLELTVSRLTKGMPAPEKNGAKNISGNMRLNGLQPAKLAVWDKDRLILLDPENDILFFKSENRKTLVCSKKGVIEVQLPLKAIEERFQERGFLQVHKSYIVNFSMIKEIVPWFNDTYVLKLKDYNSGEIPVSRHFLPRFREAIQI
ncbi:MAG: LytTR family DNA-binding domain-containing protein [Acidaminococcales bacterium]|jgi:DNA-binding LytR/AlgR family response regulator|nr:LytTR family DNA-binding domain-containing protein [Acidaminococcales bacterium]